jgi:hypothetical protein
MTHHKKANHNPSSAPRAAPPAKAERPLPFAPGERLRYQATWSGLKAADIELTVSEGSSPGALRLGVAAGTIELARALFEASYDIAAECDRSTLLPLSVRRVLREQGETRTLAARFDRAGRRIEVGGRSLPLDPAAHDPLTVLYWLRAQSFGPPGTVVNVSLNDLGKPLELSIRVVSREAGLVRLELRSREPGGATPQVYDVALAERGRRELVELKAALPIGEVLLRQVP